MKKYIALFSLVSFFFVSAVNAQTQKMFTASVGYDQASLDAALKAKTFEFTVKGITETEASEMQKKATYYTNSFDLKISNAAEGKVFKAAFVNDTQMKILYRFFLSNNISEVIYKGEKISAENFFKQWMQ